MANNDPTLKGDMDHAPTTAGSTAIKPIDPDKRQSDEVLESLYHKSMDRGLSFLSFISRNSSTSPADCSKTSSGIFCRICHDGEGSERLISPCMCSGSMALVHRTCIEKWLSTANNDNCELCHHKYIISKHPRPFVNWLCEPGVEDDQRNLVGDIVCFFLLTPLAAISTYLCATGAAFYLEEKKSESIGLICLCVVLVLIYFIWVFLTIKYHVQVWFIWRENHQEIRLIEVGKEPVQRMQWRNPYGNIDYQTVVEESSSSIPDDKSSGHPSLTSFKDSHTSLQSIASRPDIESNSSRQSFDSSKLVLQQQQPLKMQIVVSECTSKLPVVVSNHGIYANCVAQRSSSRDLESNSPASGVQNPQMQQLHCKRILPAPLSLNNAKGKPAPPPPPPPPPPATPTDNNTSVGNVFVSQGKRGKCNFYVEDDKDQLSPFAKELQTAITSRSSRRSLLSQGSCSSLSLEQPSPRAGTPSPSHLKRHHSTTDTQTNIVVPKVPERRSSLNQFSHQAAPEFIQGADQSLREESPRSKPLSPLIKQVTSNYDQSPGIERNDGIVYAQHVYTPHHKVETTPVKESSHVRCVKNPLATAEKLNIRKKRAQLEQLLNVQTLLPRDFQKPKEKWHRQTPTKAYVKPMDSSKVELPGLVLNTSYQTNSTP